MGQIHVAIIQPRYAKALRAGDKRIEVRLTRTRQPPFGRVRRGDLILFRCCGQWVGSARARRVRQFEQLTPADVDRLRMRYEQLVRGGPEFWRPRRWARYGVLIWLGPLRLDAASGVRLPRQFGRSWLTLEQRRRKPSS